MTIHHTKRLAALTLGAAFVFTACSSGSSAEPSTGGSTTPSTEPVSGDVIVDGSSTVYLISAAAAEDFIASNPDAKITVAASGTGGGFKKFCQGETQMNDASRPIKADDEGEGKACEKNGVEYVELEVALDGITVAVNTANDWATCLTVDQLKQIYGPDAAADVKWSDIDPSWPAEPIDRYMPGADSGTFDFFTEEIAGELDASTQDATQSEDDNILVQGVEGNEYAIGYFGYAYYAENSTSLKALEVDDGNGCVAPNPDTIADGTYAPLSRPLFIYPNTGEAATNAALKGFVDYYLANADTLATDVGYIAVPDDALAESVAAWNAAVGQ